MYVCVCVHVPVLTVTSCAEHLLGQGSKSHTITQRGWRPPECVSIESPCGGEAREVPRGSQRAGLSKKSGSHLSSCWSERTVGLVSPAEPVTVPVCHREDPLQGSGGSLSGQVSPAQREATPGCRRGSWRRWGQWVLGEGLKKADRSGRKWAQGPRGRGQGEGLERVSGLSAQLQDLRSAACPPRTHPVFAHGHSSPHTRTCWPPPTKMHSFHGGCSHPLS